MFAFLFSHFIKMVLFFSSRFVLHVYKMFNYVRIYNIWNVFGQYFDCERWVMAAINRRILKCAYFEAEDPNLVLLTALFSSSWRSVLIK